MARQNIPCGATTPLGRSCKIGVPERGGGNKAVYCLNQLTTATSPIGRKHEKSYKVHFTANSKIEKYKKANKIK
jgi:hypothetical protein